VNGRESLAWELARACFLTGTFTLRSGATSSFYFDKYQFEADPALLRRVASQLVQLIPDEAEVLCGLELGGIPIATALSLQTGLPAAFVRKTAKTYGTCRIAEGTSVHGKQVCLIEDVITTGGQAVASARELRARGATVNSVICVLWRGEGEPGLPEGLACVPLFTGADLVPYISVGTERG